MLVCRVYQFYVYFHVRIRLNCLVVPLPDEDGFSKVKNYFGIYAAADGNRGVGERLHRRRPDNLMRKYKESYWKVK